MAETNYMNPTVHVKLISFHAGGRLSSKPFRTLPYEIHCWCLAVGIEALTPSAASF